MLKIGITGGIGSGKTTVCRIFEVLGVPVFYSDIRAREVMQNDPLLIEGLKTAFGDSIMMDNGWPDRKKLASIVFNDEQQLQKLNALVHPAVFRDFDKWSLRQIVPYVIKEAAILFESGSDKDCDFVILVTSPVDIRIRRVVARDKISEEDVKKRMDKQLSDEEKERLSDFVILNDECHMLIPQVVKLHHYLLQARKKEQ